MLAHEGLIRRKSIQSNLIKIFNIQKIPSDTQMRTVLDEVETSNFRECFRDILSLTQKADLLDTFKFLGQDLILSIDGTCFFRSKDVKCSNCQVKKGKSGNEYSHSMFAASFVHPFKKQVLTVAPEPIVKQDGESKNDCEQNASERLLRQFRQDFPELKVTIVADALFSKGPTVKLAKELDLNFIIGAKPKDHKYLFESFEKKKFFAFLDNRIGSKKPILENLEIKESQKTYQFTFSNDMPLNQTHSDLKIGFIQCKELSKDSSKTFTWITNHKIKKSNVLKLMYAARARWKIENETFNTLKKQGYNFEHNYGHGKKNLANNMAMLMMLDFLIDQIQEICCKVFSEITGFVNRKALWDCIRSFFGSLKFDSWDDLLRAILAEYSTA